MTGRLHGRVALITGASRGIGAAVAERFAREGAHVILLARTVGGLEKVDDAIRTVGGNATLVACDITDYAKIDMLAAQIAQRFGRLDILVGNAAMLGDLTPLAHADPASWDKVMAVNVTANWRLIRNFDALLRASDAGRALFVTSGITHGATPFWGAYATSKAALEMLVKTYATEVASTPLKVNLVDPGIVRTRMRATAMPGEDPATLPEPSTITHVFVELASSACTTHGQIVSVQKNYS